MNIDDGVRRDPVPGKAEDDPAAPISQPSATGTGGTSPPPHPPGGGGMRLDFIDVGQRRRRDLGGLDELAESMRAVGLLDPVVITESRQLIAGQRRLEAARLLGWSEIQVHVVTELTEAAAGHEQKRRRDEWLAERGIDTRTDFATYFAILTASRKHHGVNGKRRLIVPNND